MEIFNTKIMEKTYQFMRISHAIKITGIVIVKERGLL